MNKDLLALARTDNVSDLPLFRAFDDIPRIANPGELVKVVKPYVPGKSYEEVHWATLSPRYREAHNRLRKARGQAPIPPPQVDLYKPPPPQIRTFDPMDREALSAARGFMGTPIMGGGSEGFTAPSKYREVFGNR